jgi:truncated hemoglobin YjbI
VVKVKLVFEYDEGLERLLVRGKKLLGKTEALMFLIPPHKLQEYIMHANDVAANLDIEPLNLSLVCARLLPLMGNLGYQLELAEKWVAEHPQKFGDRALRDMLKKYYREVHRVFKDPDLAALVLLYFAKGDLLMPLSTWNALRQAREADGMWCGPSFKEHARALEKYLIENFFSGGLLERFNAVVAHTKLTLDEYRTGGQREEDEFEDMSRTLQDEFERAEKEGLTGEKLLDRAFERAVERNIQKYGEEKVALWVARLAKTAEEAKKLTEEENKEMTDVFREEVKRAAKEGLEGKELATRAIQRAFERNKAKFGEEKAMAWLRRMQTAVHRLAKEEDKKIFG